MFLSADNRATNKSVAASLSSFYLSLKPNPFPELYERQGIQGARVRVAEYRMYKPPTTIKQRHTNTLNQAIFISESAAVTYPQTV